MTSEGAAADAARADVRDLIAAKGHTVDNARAVVERLDQPTRKPKNIALRPRLVVRGTTAAPRPESDHT